MVKCLACDIRKQKCLQDCPTRDLFENQLGYRRAVRIFTYEHIIDWIVEANEQNA
ncbi:hypothetical protein A2U01_0043344, partial [Trifolium medium]|nr:hypothetical protein [Trifolium medium]